MSRGEKLSTVIDEAPSGVIETDKVKIRPNAMITDDLRAKIKKIALDYALGEYNSMSDYTINLGNHARSLGLSYGQFYDELTATLFQLEKSIKFDKSSVVLLLMKR